MPKYGKFQYAIKKYGAFESVVKKKNKLFFLKARLGIMENGIVKYIYSANPKKIKGERKIFRLSSNKGEMINIQTIQVKGNMDKVRITSNKKEEIKTMKGWG